MTVHSNAFEVIKPGMLSLLQDNGRFGQSHLGLTNGGPMDKVAYAWLNRLLNNANNATCIEVSIGGLVLKSNIRTVICITGAPMPFTINGDAKGLWRSYEVSPGDVIELGFSQQGVRTYVGIAGGFQVTPSFSSTATVVREKVGGLNGGALQAGDLLAAFSQSKKHHSQFLEAEHQPSYQLNCHLKVIPGYQQQQFSRLQQRRFFSGNYSVSKQWDRMGYRLSGPAISCDVNNMLSEGITLGAIQIPPDGQPIVLMQDRQTIGGYPKIGSVFSLDLYKLAQCGQGAEIEFEPITIDCAHNLLMLAKRKFEQTPIVSES